MKIWLTTDTHFSHTRMVAMGRPADFEQKIKKHLRETVRPSDLLIHLGDVCLGDDQQNNSWFKKSLKCRTVLVLGNHDHRSVNWYMDNGWDFVCGTFTQTLFGKRIVFSHIPQMYDKELYDLNIHGHLHEHKHRQDGKAFHTHDRDFALVSLEFNKYQPISLESLIKKL